MHNHRAIGDFFPQDEPLLARTRDSDAPEVEVLKASPSVVCITRISFEKVKSRVDPGHASALRRVGVHLREHRVGLG